MDIVLKGDAMNPVCYLQDTCPHYENGHKRKSHHIRITQPCSKYLDDSCGTALEVRMFYGETIACSIDKKPVQLKLDFSDV